MSHVCERVTIRFPYSKARTLLREFVESAIAAGTPQVVEFVLGAARSPLRKTVLLQYERGHDPLQFDERWNVSWTPQGGGPYPDFHGELGIGMSPTRETILELTGDYVPPLGLLGETFDFVAGSRLAAATACALLVRIVRELEERHQREIDAH
ncbi:MAG TPA: hypothetical protein VNG31_02510 [Candidatus Baltobacteraceae bacterium]|nr:hypothetical protein [Candidatus Baltobacteraceae bacterium]